jgi:hypothetical protein
MLPPLRLRSNTTSSRTTTSRGAPTPTAATPQIHSDIVKIATGNTHASVHPSRQKPRSRRSSRNQKRPTTTMFNKIIIIAPLLPYGGASQYHYHPPYLTGEPSNIIIITKSVLISSSHFCDSFSHPRCSLRGSTDRHRPRASNGHAFRLPGTHSLPTTFFEPSIYSLVYLVTHSSTM